MRMSLRNPSTTVEMTYSLFFYPGVGPMELWAHSKDDSKMGQTHI